MTNNKTLIFWDWNGTIVNDVWLFVKILNVFLKNVSQPPISVDMYRDLFCFPIEDFYKKINLHLKKGGVFYIVDFHPVLGMFDEKIEKIKYEYFNKTTCIENVQGYCLPVPVFSSVLQLKKSISSFLSH